MSVLRRIIASRPVAATRVALERATEFSLHWIAENTPVVGQRAKRQRLRVVLPPYTRLHTLRGPILKVAALSVLPILCLAYGFFFGLTAPYLIIQFIVPIIILSFLVIWALPETGGWPSIFIELLYALFFIILLLWPNYIALSLPGLPWITFIRLISTPMSILLLVNLSTSRHFRRRTLESVTSIRLMWIFICGFAVVETYTLGFSPAPKVSVQIFLTHLTNWVVIFVLSSLIFRNIKYIERYFALLCYLSIMMVILTVFENRREYIPWASHIPAILQINAPSIHNTLTPSFRPYTNIYRAKGIFSTPLQLAEYLSLMSPIFLYFLFNSKRLFVKIFSFSMLPILFIAIRMTDARLGVVGMLVSVLLYGSIWSVIRWRSRPRDLFAAAVVYGYPAVFAGAVAAVFASARLSAMVFGGGAQVGSTNARKDQLAMAMTALQKVPWGHGAGQSGAALGFSEGQAITVDNYFISISMDYGVPGVILWYAIFLTAIFFSLRYCISPKYTGRHEARLLAPLGVMMVAFLVIKWVHGQDENHPIYFMVLGMISALVLNLKKGPHPAAQAPSD
jgi:hypothetical protein